MEKRLLELSQQPEYRVSWDAWPLIFARVVVETPSAPIPNQPCHQSLQQAPEWIRKALSCPSVVFSHVLRFVCSLTGGNTCSRRDLGVHVVREKLCDAFLQWVSVEYLRLGGQRPKPYACGAPGSRGLVVSQRAAAAFLSPL